MTDGKFFDSHILDLREELEELVPHFQWFGLRQPDYSKPCVCRISNSEGSITSSGCSRCFRIGFLFTDYLVKGYLWQSSMGFEFKTQVAQISTQRQNFILKHDRTINKFDLLLMMDLDPNSGVIRQPIKIMRIFQLQDTMPLFGKDGRVEFFKGTVEERNIDDSLLGPIGTSFTYKGNRSANEPW
jgi:hypothetical protein